MLESEAAQIVVALNQTYMAGAAELCRRNAKLAGILLHLPASDVEALASCTPLEVNRLTAVPLALVRPHQSMRQVFTSTSSADLLAPLISALKPVEGDEE